MSAHYDMSETRDPEDREQALFAELADRIAYAMANAPSWAAWLAGIEPREITDRAALARLPVLRKDALIRAQAAHPPLGGFTVRAGPTPPRLFRSPGPLYEPERPGADPWAGARALFAAGFRSGDLVHNSFSYHMMPGGFILDSAARALGCTVFPAGPSHTDQQIAAIVHMRPNGYVGTPDHLKILLDRAVVSGIDITSIRHGLVSGGAFFPSLRAEYAACGISVLQAYATADLGVIAYESAPESGLIVNEGLIVEIVRPGTAEPIPDGEVGEVVVTRFDPLYPLFRFGTGDLSAILPGVSACGRTNLRLAGWKGRADQRTKVRGVFVDPAQIDAVRSKVPGLSRLRLTVARDGESDALQLTAERTVHTADPDDILSKKLAEAFGAVTGLKASVTIVPHEGLPNDGKVIVDKRDYGIGTAGGS